MWKDVAVTRLDPRRFDAVLDPAQCGRFLRRLEQAADRLEGRRLWHLNSTEQGGGVAEMLQFLLGYLAGVGIDVRWVVVGGDERFFEVTKRLHNLLHGLPATATASTGRNGMCTSRRSRRRASSFDNKSPPATSSSYTTRRPWGSLRP